MMRMMEEQEENENEEEDEQELLASGEDGKNGTTIENLSEVPYKEDSGACEIDDGYIARILMRALKGKKGVEDEDMWMRYEEDEQDGMKKKKKLNKNSRAYKKEKKEREAAAQKEREEKAAKIMEEQKRLDEQKPVSKYIHARPTKKTFTGLQSLAKKQQQKNKT